MLAFSDEFGVRCALVTFVFRFTLLPYYWRYVAITNILIFLYILLILVFEGKIVQHWGFPRIVFCKEICLKSFVQHFYENSPLYLSYNF